LWQQVLEVRFAVEGCQNGVLGTAVLLNVLGKYMREKVHAYLGL
jgi:hypothetical protein